MLLVGFGRLAWLASRSERLRARPLDRSRAKTLPGSYGLRRPVVLLQSDHPTMLVTWGWLRPKVILPAGARDWTRDRVRVVLCHELAHIRRGDWAAQMTAELLRSLLLVQPAHLDREPAPAPRERTGVRRRGVEPGYRWSRIRPAFARSGAGRQEPPAKPVSRRSGAGHAASVQPREENQFHAEHTSQSPSGHAAGSSRPRWQGCSVSRCSSPGSEPRPRALPRCPDPSSIR